MKPLLRWLATTITTLLLVSACRDAAVPAPPEASQRESLVGAWRSQVRFQGGALADLKDLEFMYVFNAGGTMTESSNYDAAPPSAPAYGTWRKTGARQFEAKYLFYLTKTPAAFEEIAKGGGWLPTGHGVLTEKITLSDDGSTFKSTIKFAAFDSSGKPADGAGEGAGTGTRMEF